MEATAYEQFRDLEEHHWWFRGRRSVYLGLLASHLREERPVRALDLGCGMGGFLAGLSTLSTRAFPADISTESLVHVHERGFDGGVMLDAYALPYQSDSFDLICMFDPPVVGSAILDQFDRKTEPVELRTQVLYENKRDRQGFLVEINNG